MAVGEEPRMFEGVDDGVIKVFLFCCKCNEEGMDIAAAAADDDDDDDDDVAEETGLHVVIILLLVAGLKHTGLNCEVAVGCIITGVGF